MKGTFLIKFNKSIGNLERDKYYHLNVDNPKSYCIRDFLSGKKPLYYNDINITTDEIEKLGHAIPLSITVDLKFKEYWEKFFTITNNLPDTIDIKDTKTQKRISQIVCRNLSTDNKRRIVPNTKLSDLYNLLHENIPKTLGEYFIDAVTTLKPYNNINEPFKVTSSTKYKSNLQEYFMHRGTVIINGESYLFLAQEASLLRTTSSIKADGTSASSSGKGGVDLLCYNVNSHCPVIIEYKSVKDKSLFHALIQGLMYCSELLPENQMERFKRHHLNKELPEEDPKHEVELCIIYEKGKKGTNNEKEEQNDLNYTIDVAKQLQKYLKDKKYTGLSNISFIEVEQLPNKGFMFNIKK